MLPLTVVVTGVLSAPTTVTVSRTLPFSGVAVTVTVSPAVAVSLSTVADTPSATVTV